MGILAAQVNEMACPIAATKMAKRNIVLIDGRTNFKLKQEFVGSKSKIPAFGDG